MACDFIPFQQHFSHIRTMGGWTVVCSGLCLLSKRSPLQAGPESGTARFNWATRFILIVWSYPWTPSMKIEDSQMRTSLSAPARRAFFLDTVMFMWTGQFQEKQLCYFLVFILPTLEAPITNAADDSLEHFFIVFFLEKIRLDIICANLLVLPQR